VHLWLPRVGQLEISCAAQCMSHFNAASTTCSIYWMPEQLCTREMGSKVSPSATSKKYVYNNFFLWRIDMTAFTLPKHRVTDNYYIQRVQYLPDDRSGTTPSTVESPYRHRRARKKYGGIYQRLFALFPRRRNKAMVQTLEARGSLAF
jgi:hypothetical protein